MNISQKDTTITRIGQDALIALGANLPGRFGRPERALGAALRHLAERGLRLRRLSRFYATPCFPAGAGPDYVNAAALVTVSCAPERVLEILHSVEAEAGRERSARWAGRTLDLDLLAIGGKTLPDEKTHEQWRDLAAERQAVEAPDRLILPHPRIQDRGFVLVPLADVAPGWRHPTLGRTVREMLDALPAEARAGIVPL